MNHQQRLVIVSNRLPFQIEGEDRIVPGSGGLVTALAPILRNRGGMWIGWPGPVEKTTKITDLFERNKSTFGYKIEPVFIAEKDYQSYYKGFSNEVIWPLFHDLRSFCHFMPEYWESYNRVNSLFADTVIQNTSPDDFIWVHDYHLMLVGSELKKKGATQKSGFFLHIPFPSLDMFLYLPWRYELIEALIQFDLIGFQTMRDVRNFISCARRLVKGMVCKQVGGLHVCKIGNREIRVGAFPISIDPREFERVAHFTEVENEMAKMRALLPDQKIIFSIDRLDYTKGILYRLDAFRYFLEKYPEFKKKVAYIQIVIPSRIDIPQYNELKTAIDRKVGEINSHFSVDVWSPIHYLFRSINRIELVSYYQMADCALITPLKDGMNLVAKEYVASKINGEGVLILSEFAGAAVQFQKEALLVNPYDIIGIGQALKTALEMPVMEKKLRIKKMQKNLKKQDVFWWVKSFLNAAFSKELNDFPLSEDFIPKKEGDSSPLLDFMIY